MGRLQSGDLVSRSSDLLTSIDSFHADHITGGIGDRIPHYGNACATGLHHSEVRRRHKGRNLQTVDRTLNCNGSRSYILFCSSFSAVQKFTSGLQRGGQSRPTLCRIIYLITCGSIGHGFL